MILGNLNLGLHGSQRGDIPVTPRDSHGREYGGTLTFISNDITQDRRIIEQAGGQILGGADEAWGQMLVFEDPDGNVFKLMKPK